ncbi:transmembrane protein, putative (macronuclear) [Tetrahymena thermophila SB210]|uniref:Transmembrane protein, putative n=1 Tax=Tetrahymena thermophila (strain SB210) TaxID=312017 RepID=Q233Q6_TETTS|nr:transmembrane protein, putative [Tetrahymena thermophila SB210]EAR91773.2 transmembrane protein, putative [Tetrahymena thermophila SB210]|eukprot:XP_001012018.2 transmembrane protein, putative [Tetrahymena thermophila SB210]
MQQVIIRNTQIATSNGLVGLMSPYPTVLIVTIMQQYEYKYQSYHEESLKFIKSIQEQNDQFPFSTFKLELEFPYEESKYSCETRPIRSQMHAKMQQQNQDCSILLDVTKVYQVVNGSKENRANITVKCYRRSVIAKYVLSVSAKDTFNVDACVYCQENINNKAQLTQQEYSNIKKVINIYINCKRNQIKEIANGDTDYLKHLPNTYEVTMRQENRNGYPLNHLENKKFIIIILTLIIQIAIITLLKSRSYSTIKKYLYTSLILSSQQSGQTFQLFEKHLYPALSVILSYGLRDQNLYHSFDFTGFAFQCPRCSQKINYQYLDQSVKNQMFQKEF